MGGYRRNAWVVIAEIRITQDEQKAFKVYFDTIAIEIKKCSPDTKRQNIIKGNKVMNALCEDFQEKIDMIRFLGAI